MRLLRNNEEDARVLHDVDLLVQQFGVSGDDAGEVPEADGEIEAVAAHAPPPGSIEAIEDPFVRRAVRTSVHVRRYFPFYAGAALWLFAMLLIQPVGRDGGTEAAAPASFPRGAIASTPAEPALIDAAPSGDIGATSGAGGGFSFESVPDRSDFAAGGSSGSSTGSDFASSSDFESGGFDSGSFDSGGFETPAIEVEDEPEPLRITKSGYSSRTAGPLEQPPPGEGLPVGTVAGQPSKRSFIGLSGDETILRLKLIDDKSNVNASGAAVRACPIVADDWKAERGQPFAAQPPFSEPCVDGKRGDDGVFSFDLSSYGKPGSLAGFALIPRDAATESFNITFDPKTVTG